VLHFALWITDRGALLLTPFTKSRSTAARSITAFGTAAMQVFHGNMLGMALNMKP
jgi:hypothetical protein